MSMDRKPLGVAIIVATALALLIVNKASGRDAQGTAVPAPPLPVPAAGACIEVPAATRVLVTRATVVGCTGPHTGEVVKAWATRSLATSMIPCGVIAHADFAAAGNWAIPPVTAVSFPVSDGGPVGNGGSGPGSGRIRRAHLADFHRLRAAIVPADVSARTG